MAAFGSSYVPLARPVPPFRVMKLGAGCVFLRLRLIPGVNRATGVGSFKSFQTQKEDLHPWHHEYRPVSASVQRSTRCSALTTTFPSCSRRSVVSPSASSCSRRSRPRSTRSWAGVPMNDESEDTPAGSRNGWQPPVAVKTTMGPVELSRPKLRDTDERFCSQLFGLGVTRTNALEALVISAWVRGLSDRDIEAALREVLGDEAALSRSTVARICQQVKDEFAAFSVKDLSRLRIDYLFLDGTNFRFHEHSPAEPVLCAWGIDTDGKPHLVGLAAASSESTDAWVDFLEGLVTRKLASPLLVVSDGAPGLIAAIEQVFPFASPKVCHPPTPQRSRQGLQGRPGRLQVRLVGGLRQDRGTTR